MNLVKLTAAVAVKLPVTVSFQFTEQPLILTEVKGGAADLKKQPFLATITYAGYLSDGCVGGTEDITDDSGKVVGPLRIFIPVNVMEGRVAELAGKAVFAAETLDTHDGSVEVGQFYDAYMERIRGTEIHTVRASGCFDKRSNEALIAKIIDRARSGELGFSYDLKDAPGHLDSEMYPGETILVLDDFKWRGATVLRSNAAAYFYTNLAAKRAAGKSPALTASTDPAQRQTIPAGTSTDSTPSGTQSQEIDMTKEELAAALAAELAPLSTSVAALTAKQEAFETRFVALEAAAKAPVKEVVKEAAKEPATLTAADLGKAISDGVVAGLKAAGVTPEAAAGGKGKRMTFTAAEMATVKRYNADAFDTEGNATVDGLSAALAAVSDRSDLTTEAKTRLLEHIGAMRNQILRASRGTVGVN